MSQEQAISEDVGLTWNDDESFDIDGANFRASIVDRFRSSRRRFLLVKPRAMVEPYGEVLASLEAEHILELGSCQGGGAALFALLCQPERLVAVDIKGGPDGRSRALQLRARAARDDVMRTKLAEHPVLGTTPTPLSVMLFELVLASAYAPDVFAEIVITNGWVHVVRGDRDLDRRASDVSRIYSDTARALIGRPA